MTSISGDKQMNNIIKLLNTLQFDKALIEAEREIYEAAYKYTGGNQSEAARLLGVARGTFRARMKELSIK